LQNTHGLFFAGRAPRLKPPLLLPTRILLF
jgi:hypothetical protein